MYTREFLLSLYLEEKAGRRPIELGWHEVATVTEEGKGGRPWALREWREGEKGVSGLFFFRSFAAWGVFFLPSFGRVVGGWRESEIKMRGIRR